MNFNEATAIGLKVINEFQKLGWEPGDILLYQPEYKLTEGQQKDFPGHFITCKLQVLSHRLYTLINGRPQRAASMK